MLKDEIRKTNYIKGLKKMRVRKKTLIKRIRIFNGRV
jgi:hypothetical protein